MDGTGRRVLIFCGKGGVGKTTCSAAIASFLASRGQGVLHLTSDLAPSLSDLYGVTVGDRITSIASGLDGLEISMESVARVWKTKFGPDFTAILAHILDMEGMSAHSDLDLVDYIGTAPSLREETLLDMIVEMSRSMRYGTIIWDTAPTGETLRLLDMPLLMKKHLSAGARVYEAIDKLAGTVSGKKTMTGIMDEWVKRSEGLSEFMRQEVSFIIVSNPESVVVPQAGRTLEELGRLGLRILGLVANRVAPSDDGHGEFVNGMRASQRPHMERLSALAREGGLPMARVLFSRDEIRGLDRLREVGEGIARELGI